MQLNKQRYELLLNGEVAISHNRDTTSPDVKLIRKLCKDPSIEGNSSLYWFDEVGWGSGPDNRINHVPHYPATWFFEQEGPRYEVKSWVCDCGIWDNWNKTFVGRPIESEKIAGEILKWYQSID